MNWKQAAETFSIVSCSTRDTSPRDLCIMTLYRYIDKLDNEGNNEEYFPLKFQKNTYFNFMLTKRRSALLFEVRKLKRTEKIERSYDSSLSMAVGTREYECPAYHLALRLSLMKINTGSKVLLFGAFGYTEALVLDLVGPFGNVTVVTRNAIDILTSKSLVDQSPIKNINYLLVDEWIEGIKEKVPSIYISRHFSLNFSFFCSLEINVISSNIHHLNRSF